MKNLLLKLFACTLVIGLLSACQGDQGGGQTADGVIQINFINGFTGGDGEFMRRITDAFNASQDRIFVNEQQEPDHYIQFITGDFDLLVIHGDLIATYITDGLIQPVNSIYEAAGLSINDFLPAGQNLVNFGGQLYAFPLDIHPLTMFYNRTLVSQTPASWADLLALQDTLPPNVYPMGIPGAGLVEWYMMFLAAQDGVTVSDGEAMLFDTNEFADSVLMLNRMLFHYEISPLNLGLDGEFSTFMNDEPSAASPQTAVALTGPWFYTAALERFGDDLGVAPLPVIGRSGGTYGGSHTIAVSSSVTDQARLDAIAEYMAFMFEVSNILIWAESGQAPLLSAAADYILTNRDRFPLPYANINQFGNVRTAPPVYQVREQTRFLNENVFATIVSTPGLTREALMPELEQATRFAREVAEQ